MERPEFPWNDLIQMTNNPEGIGRPIIIALSSVFDAIMYLADQQEQPTEMETFPPPLADKVLADPLMP